MTTQSKADKPKNKNYRIITVDLMDLPKQIRKWDSLELEPDRYEFFQPAGAYVLFLRPKPKEVRSE